MEDNTDEGIADGVGLPAKVIPMIPDKVVFQNKLAQDIEKEIYELSKKEEEDERAEDILSEVTDLMESLYKKAGELSELSFSDFAANCASDIYRGTDNLNNSLRESCAESKKTELNKKLKCLNSNQ